MQKFSFARGSRAFTLIELLVVISIIGILALIILPNMVGIRGRARDTALKADLTQMKTALRLYYNDKQQYPTDNGGGIMNGCDADGESACSVAGEFSDSTSGTLYMKQLPEDFYYEMAAAGDDFFAYAVLENLSDESIATSVERCASVIGTPVEGAFYVCSD